MLSRLTWGIIAGVVVATILAELASARRAEGHRKGAEKGKGVQGPQEHQVSQWQPRWRKRPSKPGLTLYMEV